MITLKKRGRLGNNIFQNVVASIFSKKFDLKVEKYIDEDACKHIGCVFNHSGKTYKNDAIPINDKNFLTVLKEEKIDYGLDLNGFFQKPEFVINYKEEILSNFDLTYEPPENNDLFIHVRLGDLIECNAGIDYYSKAIESITYNRGFISTDDFDHDIVKTLMKKYELTPCYQSPVSTINFAKNFNNLVLSLSTFSWWIGFLSKAKIIIYPQNIFPKSKIESINFRRYQLRGTMNTLYNLFKYMETWKIITQHNNN
jgi:hypothetical protein